MYVQHNHQDSMDQLINIGTDIIFTFSESPGLESQLLKPLSGECVSR